jgi:hypothetical protein
MNLSDLDKYSVCDWFFDNNTQVSIDKNKKTITLSIAPDRHYSNNEDLRSFDAFLTDNSGMKSIILNNPDIQKGNAAELIIDTVSYYASEKYAQDVEQSIRESRLYLDGLPSLNFSQTEQDFLNLITVPNYSVKKLNPQSVLSDLVHQVKGETTVFEFSFRDKLYHHLIDVATGKEIEMQLPQAESRVFYRGLFADKLYFLQAGADVFMMNEGGGIVHEINSNDQIQRYFRIDKIAWYASNFFIRLSNKIDDSDTTWITWDSKTGKISGKVSTRIENATEENNEQVNSITETRGETSQERQDSTPVNHAENAKRKVNDPHLLSTISIIKKQQKNTIIALGIFGVVLNLGPIIGLFYNQKAAFFLIPTVLLSIVLIVQMVKIGRYTLKYGSASILEVTVSSTPTGTNNKYSALVYFVIVDLHTLYEATEQGINFDRKTVTTSTKYQISLEMKNRITGCKEISFITKGKNEIAGILEVK